MRLNLSLPSFIAPLLQTTRRRPILSPPTGCCFKPLRSQGENMQAPDHINTGILASPAPAGPQPSVLDPPKMFPTDPLPPASVRPVSAGDIPRRISLEKSGQTMNTRKSTCVL